jgi:hypothetical protein
MDLRPVLEESQWFQEKWGRDVPAKDQFNPQFTESVVCLTGLLQTYASYEGDMFVHMRTEIHSRLEAVKGKSFKKRAADHECRWVQYDVKRLKHQTAVDERKAKKEIAERLAKEVARTVTVEEEPEQASKKEVKKRRAINVDGFKDDESYQMLTRLASGQRNADDVKFLRESIRV